MCVCVGGGGGLKLLKHLTSSQHHLRHVNYKNPKTYGGCTPYPLKFCFILHVCIQTQHCYAVHPFPCISALKLLPPCQIVIHYLHIFDFEADDQHGYNLYNIMHCILCLDDLMYTPSRQLNSTQNVSRLHLCIKFSMPPDTHPKMSMHIAPYCMHGIAVFIRIWKQILYQQNKLGEHHSLYR